MTPPNNRDDLFDSAAVGVIVSLVSSMVLMYAGFSQTSSDIATVNTYPEISLSLLQINSVVAQCISSQFPDIFQSLKSEPGALVHMHSLVIAGAVSFIASTLQLLPVDNSAGSKMVCLNKNVHSSSVSFSDACRP